MQEFLVKNMTKQIENVNDKDIYAFDLYLEFEDDNPYQPLIIFGYNTLTKVEEEMNSSNVNELEAKWNYAYWLQNSLFTLGEESTYQIVEDWLTKHRFGHQVSDEFININLYNKIEKKLYNELANAVKTVQKSNVIQKKFGKSLPIIIHELEYTDFIAKLNKKANPKDTIQEFLMF